MIAIGALALATCILSFGGHLPVSDSADVVGVVSRFHAALGAGDSGRVLELMSTDAVILESGDWETLEHYRSHHLPDDIEFARAIPSTNSLVRVYTDDDDAWVASESVSQGQFAGRKINSNGVELVVLRRVRGQWKIQAIHWSSRVRRTTPAK